MYYLNRLVLALLLVTTCNGCAALLVHDALDRNMSRKERAEANRHQERMRELDILERRLKQSNTVIITQNPF